MLTKWNEEKHLLLLNFLGSFMGNESENSRWANAVIGRMVCHMYVEWNAKVLHFNLFLFFQYLGLLPYSLHHC